MSEKNTRPDLKAFVVTKSVYKSGKITGKQEDRAGGSYNNMVTCYKNMVIRFKITVKRYK